MSLTQKETDGKSLDIRNICPFTNMHFDIRLFISSLLLIAATLPPLHGLSDSMIYDL